MKSFTRILFTSLAIALLAVPAFAETPKSCTSNKECATSEFCDTSPKCHNGKVSGICKTKPTACSQIYLPVKGCNGKEYSNACEAAAHGQPNTGPVKK